MRHQLNDYLYFESSNQPVGKLFILLDKVPEEFKMALYSVSFQINGAIVMFSGLSISSLDTRSSKPIDSKFTEIGTKYF